MDGKWKSRALTPTERRYLQIEKEALATIWTWAERLSDFLNGKRFLVETEHKPLVPILNSKNLEEMSPQIQRLRMRLLRFDFTVSHVSGKSLITADIPSRGPSTDQDEQQGQCLEEKIDLYIQTVFTSLAVSNTQLERIREKQEEDRDNAVMAGQTGPQCQILLNPTGRSKRRSRSSMDCFLKPIG